MDLVPIVSSTDEVAWLEARRRGVTATDVAKVGGNAGAATLRRILADKRGEGAMWRGNDSTRHGHAREPMIQAWVAEQSRAGRFGSGPLVPSGNLYAHPDHPQYLATPDGQSEDWDYYRELVEIKTTVKPLKTVPADYLRQIRWQQYVTGAERTLFVWELRDEHFRPVDLEPNWQWVKRDQAHIDEVVAAAERLLAMMHETPLADPVMDALITAYLDAKSEMEQAKASVDAFEKRIRQLLDDTDCSVMGARGDLTFTHTTSMRFAQKEFSEDHPGLFEQYKRETAGTRLTITPVKGTRAEEAAA